MWHPVYMALGLLVGFGLFKFFEVNMPPPEAFVKNNFRYAETHYRLDDGTPCVVLTISGRTDVYMLTCNYGGANE